MSTLVFSDTHLTARFDPNKYKFLTELISHFKTVAINGDFWDGYLITFDQFLDSEWSRLFPLLKNKKAIYIYGNHDDARFSDNRVSNFCEFATTEYKLTTHGTSYLFKHGDDVFSPSYNDKRRDYGFNRARKWDLVFQEMIADVTQAMLFRALGPRALPNFLNRVSKEALNEYTNPHQLLVCGHTHRPSGSENGGVLNLGFINYGWANYLEINDAGNYKLVSRRY